MGKAVRVLGILALSLQLAGCAADLLSGPPPTTFELRATLPGGSYGRTGQLLGVREPHALQILDSERIVYRPEPALITYYAGAQWSDRLPRLVEARLLAAFETAGVRTVTRATDGLRVQYQLLTDVRDFSVARTADGPVARVGIYAKLASDYSGRAVTGRLFEAEAPVAGESTAAGVAALDAAFTAALADIVRWTLTRI